MPYNHAEAFALMTYRCTVGHVETLWNSRDGVTPFIIRCKTCGGEAQHVNWRSDVCDPFYQPEAGMRIFMDAGPHDDSPRITTVQGERIAPTVKPEETPVKKDRAYYRRLRHG